VKDPVCETYVPRRTALARTDGVATYYFCGPTCAAKFKTPS
jgi:YHS domain-containing protein